MKAVIVKTQGEPSEVVTVSEVADSPKLQADQVLIRVLKRIIHPADYQAIRGILPAEVLGSGVPGSDGMGVVEEVGSDVPASAGIVPGMRVIFYPVRGSWIDRVVASPAVIVPLPDDISDHAGSQILANGLTAITLLRAADEAVGNSVPLLVSAAGSSVGSNIIALARMRGRKVVALVRSEEGAAYLADRFDNLDVVSTDRAGWQTSVHAAMGASPTIALDPVGGKLLPDLLPVMANGGTLIVYGGLDPSPSPVSSIYLAFRELTIKGVSVMGPKAQVSPEQRAADIAELFEMARQTPQIFENCSEFELTEAVAGIANAEGRPRRGATILISGA